MGKGLGLAGKFFLRLSLHFFPHLGLLLFLGPQPRLARKGEGVGEEVPKTLPHALF